MSIQSEITRLATAKSDLRAAINAKGGALVNESISAYAAAVSGLQTGGCTIAMAETTLTDDARSISFTGLTKEPKMFCILSTGSENRTSGSPAIQSVVADGDNMYALTVHYYGGRTTSYAGINYYDTSFSWTYSGGNLTVSTTKYLYFNGDNVTYRLFYVY